MRHRDLPLLALLLTTLGLSGCGNQDTETTLDLGSVSIGAQLIDLKKARDAGAISGQEYRALKADMLTLLNNAAALNGDDDDDDKKEHRVEIRIGSDDNDEQEEDSGFLF